jgi:glyoxylase-like metal-dependent hydrolase (beta-lactamase superfamily II)
MSTSKRPAVVSTLIALVACYATQPVNARAASPSSDAIPGNSYEIQQLAPGVYAGIRHVEAGTVDGNTMFIINDSDVIVIDTGAYPTSARQMIAEIRKRTNKPVSCIINTHWHYDHTMGNQTYLNEFPGAEIISTQATRDLAISNSPSEKFVPAYQEEIINVDKKLESGKDSDGQPLTAERRKHLELAKSDFEFWIRDAKTTKAAMATTTIAESLVLHRGERTIEIRFMGQGHTPGDLVVYLPNERIVATGDLVVYPVPFGGATNLKEWPATLQVLRKLDAATIVPGHGEIQHDWNYVDREIALTRSTWEQVQKAVNGGGNLEAVRKSVNGDELSKAFGATSAKDRDEFDYTYLDSAVEAAFNELRPDIATKK